MTTYFNGYVNPDAQIIIVIPFFCLIPLQTWDYIQVSQLAGCRSVLEFTDTVRFYLWINAFSVMNTTLLNKSNLSLFLSMYIQINGMTFYTFSKPQSEIYQEIFTQDSLNSFSVACCSWPGSGLLFFVWHTDLPPCSSTPALSLVSQSQTNMKAPIDPLPPRALQYSNLIHLTNGPKISLRNIVRKCEIW